MATRKKVLILGGGFGGIKAALELEPDERFNVTLISDQPNFRYYPMLYRTATGGSSLASNIPLSELFDGKKIKFIEATASHIDRSKKTPKASGKNYNFDILIISLGVVTNYFGISGLDNYSYSIKTQVDSKKLREHLHRQLIDDKAPDLNYVVVGGGPTGVELAGALTGYLKHIMKRHGLASRPIHVDLVEAQDRLIPRMPRSYSDAVARRLRRLGVKLHLNEAVKAETAQMLKLADHDIASHTVVWTAGVTNHPFLKSSGFAISDHGKVIVDPFLQAENDIYVIGDNADTPYSGMAQTALYDAVFVAGNLKRQASGEDMGGYRPKKPIYITPVGGKWAAVLWGKTHIYGFGGWLLRNAADYSGYHEYEPWWKAAERLKATYESEETCLICAPK